MVVYFLLLLVLFLCGLRIKKDNQVLSVKDTEFLKGLGILIVFVDHIRGYFVSHHTVFPFVVDSYLLLLFQITTTLMVGMFLFFSGYGVTLSILSKGTKYVTSIPKRRLLSTILNFDIAILLFLIVDLLLNIDITYEQVAFSLIGWESIGNSNWYIFAILCCYLFSYIANILFQSKIKSANCVSFFILIYIIILSNIKDPWWYNTIAGYAGGMYFAIYKENFVRFFKHYYILSLSISTLLFLLFFRFSSNYIMCNFAIVLFGLLIILTTMKVSFKSKVLVWCGRHLFPLYIFQRLPMIIISSICAPFVTNYAYIYFAICFILTIVLAKIVPQFKLS